MARPTILTTDIHNRITDAIKKGAYFEDACDYAGIGTSTAYRWMAVADEDDHPNAAAWKEFRDSVTQARAQARIAHVATIRTAAQEGDWRASAWFLERSDPKRWGRSVKVTGDPEAPLQVTVGDLVQSDAARVAALALTAAVAAGGESPDQ